jgi:hypothetical protein
MVKLKEKDPSVIGVVEDISWLTTETDIPVENVDILSSRRRNSFF